MISKRQFTLLVLTTALAGFLGGAAATRLSGAQVAQAAKAPAAAKNVVAQEYKLVDAAGNTQVRIGYNQDGLAVVSWIYRGKDQPAQVGKEQTIVIGNMWGFGQKKPAPAQPKPAAPAPAPAPAQPKQ